MQLERQQRLGLDDLLVAPKVLAQHADALVERLLDKGSAVMVVSIVTPVTVPRQQLLGLQKQYHPAFRLREKTQQLFQQLAQEDIQVQRAREILRDLKHRLQLLRGVLREQRVVGRKRGDLGTDDGRRLVVRRLGFELQAEDVRTNLQPIGFRQRSPRRDQPSIEERPTAAAGVLHQEMPVLAQNPRVHPADGQRFQTDRTIMLPADELRVLVERERTLWLRTLQ